MCSVSILKFVSSNRIDRLEVLIIFMMTLWNLCQLARRVCKYSYFKYCIFLSIIIGFLCSELQHYSFLGFFGYYSFVVIHFLLSIYYYTWFPTAATRSYIYIHFLCVTNRRSIWILMQYWHINSLFSGKDMLPLCSIWNFFSKVK